jgi:peptide/nickel transport system substrate-binding protein
MLRAAVLMALVIAGCGPQRVTPPPPAGPGGTLRVILPFEPRTLAPNADRDEGAAILLAPNLYSRLLAVDADSRLIPDLAERWEVSPDGRSYTFRLRSGVRWHDGEPFGAEDVRWTLARLARRPGMNAEAVRRIRAVSAPDPATVVVRLTEPWAPFLPTLAACCSYIEPRHLGERPRGGKVVGTGPFRLVSWERGRRIVLAANRSFYRPGPFVDRLIFTFVRDSGRLPGLLLSGAADFSVARLPLKLLPALGRDPRLRLVTAPSDARFYCGFNLRRPRLADRRVREAINRAIDRQELLDRAMHGYGAPALGFYTPAVAWAYNGEAHVPLFDRGRSRALLAAAGLRPDAQGAVLHLDLLAADLTPYIEIAALLREQLRTVGIDLRPVLVPTDRYLERTLGSHDFDLALMAGSQGPDPESLETRFGSHGTTQFMGYASPELDAAVAEGARTVDLPRRAEAYFRAQAILARDLPVAPLLEGIHVALFRHGLRGLPQVEARGLVPLHEYSLVRVDGAGARGVP